MDSGLTLRPALNGAQASIVRPDVAPVREAVATELTPAKAVTATTGADAPRNETAKDPSQVRKIILDAHSREVIYQVLDVSSGQVVRQMPDEAMLRLRAYTRAVADGMSPNEANQADIEA